MTQVQFPALAIWWKEQTNPAWLPSFLKHVHMNNTWGLFVVDDLGPRVSAFLKGCEPGGRGGLQVWTCPCGQREKKPGGLPHESEGDSDSGTWSLERGESKQMMVLPALGTQPAGCQGWCTEWGQAGLSVLCIIAENKFCMVSDFGSVSCGYLLLF